jgi:hypothetical protein
MIRLSHQSLLLDGQMPPHTCTNIPVAVRCLLVFAWSLKCIHVDKLMRLAHWIQFYTCGHIPHGLCRELINLWESTTTYLCTEFVVLWITTVSLHIITALWVNAPLPMKEMHNMQVSWTNAIPALRKITITWRIYSFLDKWHFLCGHIPHFARRKFFKKYTASRTNAMSQCTKLVLWKRWTDVAFTWSFSFFLSLNKSMHEIVVLWTNGV